MKKLLTLVLVDSGEALLLGMKKRGFGEGNYNGFGGKVEPGETIEEAARREVREEVGLEVLRLEKVAKLTFNFASPEYPSLLVHVFRTQSYSGVPVETEEMEPAWFSYSDIPYVSMWPDDQYWLPKVLAGECVKGEFTFDAPASKTHIPVILEHSLVAVADFSDSVY